MAQFPSPVITGGIAIITNLPSTEISVNIDDESFFSFTNKAYVTYGESTTVVWNNDANHKLTINILLEGTHQITLSAEDFDDLIFEIVV